MQRKMESSGKEEEYIDMQMKMESSGKEGGCKHKWPLNVLHIGWPRVEQNE